MHKKAHPTHAKQQRPSIYFQKPSRNVCQLLAEYWPIAGENGVPIGVTILRADSGLSGNVKGTVIYSLETHCTPRCQTRNAYVSLNAATKENERRWAQRKPKHTFITCVPASQFLSRKNAYISSTNPVLLTPLILVRGSVMGWRSAFFRANKSISGFHWVLRFVHIPNLSRIFNEKKAGIPCCAPVLYLSYAQCYCTKLRSAQPCKYIPKDFGHIRFVVAHLTTAELLVATIGSFLSVVGNGLRKIDTHNMRFKKR